MKADDGERADAYDVWERALIEYGQVEDDTPYETTSRVREVAAGECDTLEAAEAERLRNYIGAQKTALDLFERVAAMDSLQLPIWSTDQRVAPWWSLARTVLARARMSACEGDWQGSVDDVSAVLRMGQLLANGEPVMVTMLVASLIQREGLGALRWIARHPDLPLDLLGEVSAASFPPENLCDVWASAVRVEMRDFVIPGIRKMGGMSAEQISKSLADELSEQGRGVVVRELLAGSKAPVDVGESVDLTERSAAAAIQACGRPWSEVRGAVFSTAPEASAAERVLADAMVWPNPIPDRETSEMTRIALENEFNPIGRQSVRQLAASLHSYLERIVDLEAQWRATYLVVRMRDFGEKRDHLPSSLGVLDLDGAPQQLRLDPFSGASFGYSSSPGRLWSVGPNGRSEEGENCWAGCGSDCLCGEDAADDLSWDLE